MNKWWPLLAVCVGSFLFLLDTTVVIVAAPRILADLTGPETSAAWVLNAYTVVLAMLMLPAGGWADRLGHRRVFAAGLVEFAIASLGCALAPSLAVLIGCRALQGIGGAAIAVAGFSLLLDSYPEETQRGRAMGVFFAINGLGAAVGPLAGGLLTGHLGWRSIFVLNVPIALATAILVWKVTPARAGGAASTDWPGTAAFALTIGALTLGLGQAATHGWLGSSTLALLATGLAGLAVFVLVERRSAAPLLRLDLFQRPAFTVTMLAAAASSAPFAALVYTSIWLQDDALLGPVSTGLIVMPLAAAVFIVSILAGGRLHGMAPRYPIGFGLLAVAAGALLQALPWADTPGRLALGLITTGVGVGLIGPTLGTAVGAATPPEHMGMGAGAMTTLRQLGQSIAVAALAFPYGHAGGHVAANLHAAEAPTAIAAAVAGLLALALLRPAPQR